MNTHVSGYVYLNRPTGNYPFCIDMSRPKYICSASTPEMCVDNVSMIRLDTLVSNGDFSSGLRG